MLLDASSRWTDDLYVLCSLFLHVHCSVLFVSVVRKCVYVYRERNVYGRNRARQFLLGFLSIKTDCSVITLSKDF